MGGITGFVDRGAQVSETHFRNAVTALHFTSLSNQPPLYYTHTHFSVGMGSRQLPTIALNNPDSQPITSSCGQYSIILSGTLYNYIELRENLIKYGVIFKTLTDAEVLIECYKKWGYGVFNYLDGSYSFCITDWKRNQMMIARDTVGSKPLYYYRNEQMYVFASEINALFHYPGIRKNLHPKAMATFFRYGHFSGEETIYEHIYAFKKGTYTIIDLHSGNSYDAPILLKGSSLPVGEDEPAILSDLEELLTESILKRNIADVPTGVLLSSGYESATIAAILQKHQHKRIKTFTLQIEDKKTDETNKASLIAQHLRTQHTVFPFGQNEAIRLLEKMPLIFEQPVGNMGVLPFLSLSESLQQEVKVILGVEGGEILFGGYQAYLRALQTRQYIRQASPLKKSWDKLFQFHPERKREITQSDNLIAIHKNLNAHFTSLELKHLLQEPAYFDPDFTPLKDDVRDLIEFDKAYFLSDALLSKADKCLSYFGIQNRDAFLKTDLIEYLSRLDSHYFIRSGQTKYLLRQITHRYLPPSLLNTQRKGFSIPLVKWLRGCFRPYIETYLDEKRLQTQALFQVNQVKEIRRNFYRYGRVNDAKKLWLLLQFQLWHERWMS